MPAIARPRLFLGITPVQQLPADLRRALGGALPATAAQRLADHRPERTLGLALLACGVRALASDAVLAGLHFDDSGRPRLPQPFDAGIAHSAGWVTVVVARTLCVGVDIEAVGDTTADTLPHYFTAAERGWAGADPRRCHQLWSRKEAVAKGDGGGLARVPAVQLHDEHAVLDGQHWTLCDFSPDPDTVGCLAVRRPHAPLPPLEARLMQPDSLLPVRTG